MTWLDRLLPALAGAGRRTRAVGCAAVGATTAGLAAHALLTAAGAGGTPAGLVAPALCSLGAIVLLVLRAATATDDRHGWRALALAAGVWLAGTAVATFAGRPAGGAATGLADPLWLAFYPLALLAVALRTRATLHGVVQRPLRRPDRHALGQRRRVAARR